MSGGLGDDTLNGAAGVDTAAGQAGNDLYIVDNPGDVVIENAGDGADTVMASASYTLPGNVEDLVLIGGAGLNGAGNAGDNVVNGNSGNNSLSGGLGNDTLNGGAGADSLAGGDGDDTFVFSAGQANGDVIADFLGSLGGGADQLVFMGFGTAAAGATFSQLNATDWQITAAGGGSSEVIHLPGGTVIAPTDYHFV
jgi:Ca2+-binding RTX toxin-like protein